MKKYILSIFTILIFSLVVVLPSYAEAVYYNVKTGKFHSFTCKWAKKCTVNCIKIDKKDAIKRGGIPCKVCGG